MFDSSASTPSERIKKKTKKAQLDPTYLACESERVEQVRKKRVDEMSKRQRKSTERSVMMVAKCRF